MAPVECLPLILPRPWGRLGAIFSSTHPPPEVLSNIVVSVLIGGESRETQGGGRGSNSFAVIQGTVLLPELELSLLPEQFCCYPRHSPSPRAGAFAPSRTPRSKGGASPRAAQEELLLQTCCLQGDLLFGLDASPQALPDWVSNYKKAVSAKTYLTKNTSLCVIRNPKPGRIF